MTHRPFKLDAEVFLKGSQLRGVVKAVNAGTYLVITANGYYASLHSNLEPLH